MIRATVARTLGFTSPDEVDVNSPLTEIGIDSLASVLIRNQLAALTGLWLPARIVLDHPNLTVLGQMLLSQVEESSGESMSESVSHSMTAPTSISLGSVLNMAVVKSGCLDASLTFDNVIQGTCAKRPESVFVTGATGFVGAFLVHQLLDMGIATFCLVRANHITHATERLVATLVDYDLWKPDYTALLNPVVGDMAQPLFGLTEEAFDQLANGVDAICHSGSLVDWLRPLEEYVGPNIISTHEVLRLASRGRAKVVHHISTASTLPKHLGYGISESEVEYGYATSKYTAERMVAAARWRGANASIYRLPFITASASTGHFRRDRGDFLHNLIMGGIQMESFPHLDTDLSVVLPVDYLAKTIANIVGHDVSRVSHDFDFVNTNAMSFDHFFKLMGMTANIGQGIISFSQWREKALTYATEHPKSPLARIATLIDGLTDEGASAMLKGLAVGKYVFGGETYPAPSLNEQSVKRYLARITSASQKDRSTTHTSQDST